MIGEAPFRRQGETLVYKVVINSVVDSSQNDPKLKNRVSYEFNVH